MFSSLNFTIYKALGGHSDVVTALAASAPHTVLISGSRDRTVIVWHLTRLSFIRQLAAHPGPISAVQVNEAKVIGLIRSFII